MATEDSESLYNGLSTHGICDNCTDNIEFQMGVPLEKFLNTLPVPIVIIDRDCRFINANQPALDIIGKDILLCRGGLTGDVFECAYARLPEGCGKTIHCSGCVIRSTISETWQTGKEFVDIPAILDSYVSSQKAAQRFHISTKKINNLVLLKMEAVKDEQTASEEKAS